VVPLVVDPQALFAVGSSVVGAGDGLAANLTVLTAGFAANTGHDAAGEVFGLAYQDAAEKLLQAAAAAVNACRQSGAKIQQGAANYSNAEAASNLRGGAGVLSAPPNPAAISPPGPPGTLGPGQPPPLLWAVVQSFVDDVWPDGDVAGMHAAAARWRGFSAGAAGMRDSLNAALVLMDAHQIPEGGKIDVALSQIRDCIAKISDASGELSARLYNFANEVGKAQNAIRDLLDQLGSLTDLGHDLMLIVKGDALDEIKRIAKDVNDVLHHLGGEARATEQAIKLGLGVVDGLVVKLEKYVRGELKQYLGDAVGNQVATVFDVFANANEGVLKGAVGTALSIADLDPRWFALDPHGAAETWAGLGKGVWKGSVINGLANPQEFVESNWQQIKGLLHLDDWSTARPGLGLGENVFDVATLLIPGGGEAAAAVDGAGAAARGAEAAAQAERAAGRAVDGFAGVAGPRGALADIAGTGSSLTKDLEGVTGKLPKIEPPVGGQPVALPPKPLDAPVAPAPRAPEGAPGAPHEPTAALVPAEAGGPHDPVPAPAGGPHDPGGGPPASVPPGAHEAPPGPAAAPAPAAPPGGPHEPGFDPPATAAPTPGGPHGGGSMPMSHSPQPPLAPGGPHEPGYEPESAPAQAGATSGGPHEPSSVPGGPHEPASEPAAGPHEPTAEPAGGPHEPEPATAPASAPTAVPAAVGDRLPSAAPAAADSARGRVPVTPGGAPAELAPAAAHSAQPTPSLSAATPHSAPPGGRPTELPTPGRSGGHGTGDGSAPGGPKPPHNNGPQGPHDGGDPLGGRQPKAPPHDATTHAPGDKGGEHNGPANADDRPSQLDTLHPHDLSALADYTGSGYRDLNDALRSNAVDASQHARIEAIKNALQKLPTYRGPVVRGTDLSPEVLAQYRPGAVITEKAFLSTTTNPAVARSTAFSGNVEFRIVSFTGRDVSSVSMFPGEREILFPPGTHFFVAGKTIDPLTGKTIIEMIER
jgi:ADP-ribosyltransferase exoenzyme